MNKNFKTILKSIFILVIFSLSVRVIAVWAPPVLSPGQEPPENNVAPPFNTGGDTQVKIGGIGVHGLQSYTFGIIDGTFDVVGIATFLSNVGIGTATPTSKLQIYEQNVDGAQYSFTESSTSGYTTTFNMNDSGLKIGINSSGRDIYFGAGGSQETRMTIKGDTGNVGIGTATPARALDVNSAGVRFSNTGNGIEFLQSSGTNWQIANLGTNTSLTVNGDLGVGTVTPGKKVDVNGGVRANEFCLGASCITVWPSGGGGINGTTDYIPRYTPNGTTLGDSLIFQQTGDNDIGISTTNPGAKLAVNGNLNVGTAYATVAGQANGAIIEGNVGIGTTSPGAKLDIKGTLRLSGSTSGYVGFTPAAVAGSTTYTFPSADGTNGQFLRTNGTGGLSWATASGGITSLNGSTVATQTFATSTTGTNFTISTVPATGVHTFNLPVASAVNTGKLSSADWTTFNNKLSNITGLITAGTNITLSGSGTSGSPYVINASGSGGGGVDGGGTGTANYVTKWIDTDTIGNSVIFNEADGDIGINTTTPGARLGVAGNLNIGTGYAGVAGQADGAIIEGNVGIGTSSPSAKLDVVGNVKFSGALMPNGNAGVDGLLLISKGPGLPPVWDTLVPYTAVNGATLRYSTGAGEWVSSTNIFNADANVGIGTLTPSQKLDVSGNVKATQFCLGTDCISAWPSGSGDNLGNHIATQTIYGSTVSAGDLLLDSTNHATKGDIILGPTSGSVGIGTLNPAQKLDVIGNVKANQFCLLTDCISVWPTGSGGTIDGSGTANYISKFTPDGNTIGNSLLFDNGTSVGIGTTAPLNPFVINGPNATSTYSTHQFAVMNSSDSNTVHATIGSNATAVYLQSWDSHPLYINNEGNNTILNPVTGNIGIGMTSPSAKLHLRAGTPTVGTAPLKFTSGTNLTTPEDGALEYNGTHFYATIGSTRYQLDQQSAGGSTALSSITAATANNPGINNLNWSQTWNWNSILTNGAGLFLGSNANGSGIVEDLIHMRMMGTTATSTATTLRVEALKSGTNNTNIGIIANAVGGTNNYAILATAGNVGIGDNNPLSLLTVGNGDLFQVNTSGDILTASAEPLSITTGTTGALTLDSGTTGAVNLGTGASAKTINIGTSGTKTINIGTNNTVADTISIGSTLDSVGITASGWSITPGGVLTVASCTGCGTGSGDNLGNHTATTNILANGDNTLDMGTPTTGFRNAYFDTGVFSPYFVGGSATTSDLNLKTTSGVGATGADMHFLVGNNGATEAMTILNSGFVGLGTTAPGTKLDLSGALSVRSMAAPAVSPATEGRIYFDSTANKFKVSENNGAYVDLVGGGGGGGTFDAIGDAVASGLVSNGSFAQEWQWNDITSNTGLKLSSSSTLATNNTQKLFEVSLSGTNANASQTTYASYITNTHSPTSGQSATNVAGYFSATNGSTNYAILAPSGRVGIGTSTPGSTFEVSQTSATGPGTVSGTSGSTTLNGTNTEFTNTLKVGDSIAVSGQSRIITIIASNTSLGVDTPWSPGVSGTYTVPVGQRFVVKGNGQVGIGTTTPTEILDINGNSIRIRTSQTPGGADVCSTGEIAWDATYLYICTDTTADWKRILLTDF